MNRPHPVYCAVKTVTFVTDYQIRLAPGSTFNKKKKKKKKKEKAVQLYFACEVHMNLKKIKISI